MNDNCISENNDDADDSFNIVVSIKNSDDNVLGDGECVDEKILLLNKNNNNNKTRSTEQCNQETTVTTTNKLSINEIINMNTIHQNLTGKSSGGRFIIDDVVATTNQKNNALREQEENGNTTSSTTNSGIYSDPNLFWSTWSQRRKECNIRLHNATMMGQTTSPINNDVQQKQQEGEQQEKSASYVVCDCFEGLGSVM